MSMLAQIETIFSKNRRLIVPLLAVLAFGAVPFSRPLAQDAAAKDAAAKDGAGKDAAAKEGPIKIRWHGQSFFELIAPNGARVVFDPHAIEAYGRKQMVADVVLISHPHTDHSRTEVVTNKDRARVIQGLKPATQPGRPAEFNPVEEEIKDLKIRNVLLYHDAMEGLVRGRNTAFIVEVAGVKIVHLGDLGHKLTREQIRQIGPVDVLMIPIGGVYTINGSEARDVVEQLQPKRMVIPMHYGTRVYEDLLGPEEFLDELPKEQIKKLPGNQVEIKPGDPVPAKPIYMLPNFE
jgi:L-ascorbate metabolism protein UlaG (beta-lactamase superfamily)